MATMQLALRISGTKQRMAGFAPLVNIGMLPAEIGANMDRVTTFSGSPAFILRHSREFICYLLLDRNVKSFDADANGVLSIALAISRDARLAGGQSPYALLMRVYETFRSYYMSLQGDGRYSYVNQDIDDTVFRKIISEYPLEARRGPYVMMRDVGASGTLAVPATNLEAFFRDTQYDEFRSFREIQIGTNCPTTPGLDSLEIPHRPRYTVYLNGKLTNVSLKEPYDRFRTQGSATEDYEYAGTEFSLQDVLTAPDGLISREEATIRLDVDENRIYCDLIKKDIWYSLVVELPVIEEKKQYIRDAVMRGDFTLYFGQENVTSQIITPSPILFKASSCKMNYPKLSGKTRDSSYIISTTKQLFPDRREMKILLNASPVPRPVSQYNPSMRANDDRYAVRRDPEEEEYIDRTPKKKGLDLLSILLGCLAGFLLGVLSMVLVAKIGRFERVPKDRVLVDTLRLNQWQEDSINLENQKKELERIVDELEANNTNNQGRLNQRGGMANTGAGANNQAAESSSKTGTPEQQIEAIMNGIKNKSSYNDVSKLPGFKSVLNSEDRKAIEWLLSTGFNCSKGENGMFRGDNKVPYTPGKASEIIDLKETFFAQGDFSLDAIRSFKKELDKCLK